MEFADLTGTQKTAILLLALGDKFTSEVFSHFDRAEITQVSRAVVALDTVSKEIIESVLREFYGSIITGRELISGGQESLKRLLTKNLDAETAKYIMEALDLNMGPVPFRELKNVSPRLLSQMLRNEHPQTLALVLGHLHSEQAANLLTMLPAGVRTEVLMRLARLEAVPEEMLMEVDRVLQSQLVAMGAKEGKKVGGVQSVAEILNSVDRSTEEEVLAEIEEDSVQMAEDIRNLMFVFDDIKGLDDRSIRELLKDVNNDELILALRSVNDEFKERIFVNMSMRASQMVRDELEFMGPTKLTDIETAQQNIVRMVRGLEASGKITISRGGADAFI